VQVQTVVVDSKCQELLALLTKARTKHNAGAPTTVRDVIAYRREAEQFLGQDEHLYRVEWVQEARLMRVWLLGPEDPSIDIDISSGQKVAKDARGGEVARWRAYMESYVLQHPTELVSEGMRGRMQRTYLSRTREETDDDPAGGTSAMTTTKLERCVVEAGVEVGIQPGSCKLVYRNGTEDVVFRWRTAEEEEEQVVSRMAARSEERARRVAGWLSRGIASLSAEEEED